MRWRSWKYHAAWFPRFTLPLSNSGGKRRKGSMRGGKGAWTERGRECEKKEGGMWREESRHEGGRGEGADR